MDIQTDKIELAKRLLDTEDENVIDAVKSIFRQFDHENEWSDLPEKVIQDVEESLRQIERGEGVSHEKARETFAKWL
ncbi:hypothetical protein [Dyadobacter crusticola]|uniref:hypothetical protein n=1 Tax=Dyadobacter crusticola TaxID=292407 RepID=UPI0004E175A5|nr:hypothetical protein [Dyadobacter crusticola]